MPLTAYSIPAGGVTLTKFGQSENADSGVPTDIPAIVKLQAESNSNNTDVFADFDAVVVPKAQ